MRGLLALVVAMGVLIVAGTAVVGVTIARRIAARPHEAARAPAMVGQAAALDVLLAEPTGTRMVTVAPLGDRLAILLQGGGPDRVAVLDAATGHALYRVMLQH